MGSWGSWGNKERFLNFISSIKATKTLDNSRDTQSLKKVDTDPQSVSSRHSCWLGFYNASGCNPNRPESYVSQIGESRINPGKTAASNHAAQIDAERYSRTPRMSLRDEGNVRRMHKVRGRYARQDAQQTRHLHNGSAYIFDAYPESIRSTSELLYAVKSAYSKVGRPRQGVSRIAQSKMAASNHAVQIDTERNSKLHG